MKKLMFAFCFVFGGLAVYAQEQDTTTTPQYPTQQDQEQYPSTTMEDSQDQDRERISSRDLPDAVKRSLEGTEYRGWLVNAAYRTSSAGDMTSTDPTMENDTTSVYGNQGNQQQDQGYGNQGSQGMENDTTSMSGQYGQGEVYIVELKNGAQTKTVRFDKDGNRLGDDGMQEDQE